MGATLFEPEPLAFVPVRSKFLVPLPPEPVTVMALPLLPPRMFNEEEVPFPFVMVSSTLVALVPDANTISFKEPDVEIGAKPKSVAVEETTNAVFAETECPRQMTTQHKVLIIIFLNFEARRERQ